MDRVLYDWDLHHERVYVATLSTNDLNVSIQQKPVRRSFSLRYVFVLVLTLLHGCVSIIVLYCKFIYSVTKILAIHKYINSNAANQIRPKPS